MASARPVETSRIEGGRFLARRWHRLAAQDYAGGTPGIVLTDDYAPVDRLMSRVTLDAGLAGE